MPSLHPLAALLVASVGLTGCLMPPCQLGAGFGITNANARESSPQPTLQFRAGFHPLQLVESMKDRSFDVGAGVVVDGTPGYRTMTSLYAEGTGVIHQSLIADSGAIAREEAGAQARLTWDRTRGVIKPGVEPIVRAEAGKFFAASVNDPSINEHGAVHGELYGGIYLGGYFGADIWAVNLGVFARVPAIAYVIAPEH